MPSDDNFLTTFHLLGSRISATPSTQRQFINLEQFLLDVTIRFRNEDSRVNEALWCWLMRYGRFFSPHKIIKLVKNKYPYDPSILGAILSGIDNKFPKSGDFASLKKFTKKDTGVPLYSFLKNPREQDKNFEKFNIIAPFFSVAETDHYIHSHSFIGKNCSEIRHRTQGYTIAIADLRAAIEIHGKQSIYFLAKITSITYAHAYECIKKFSLI